MGLLERIQARRVRLVEATADQVVATGGGYAYGAVDPIDGDTGYRRAGSSSREVPRWTREKARTYSVTAYRANPMATAIIDTYCVDEATEILTADGWKRYDAVAAGDEVLTLNHETGLSEWQPVLSMHVFPAQRRELMRLRTRDHSSLTTSNHRWPVISRRSTWRGKSRAGMRESREWRTSETLQPGDWIVRAAPPAHPAAEPKWSDDLVELVAWAYTEGHVRASGALILTQSHAVNPEYVERIDACLRRAYGAPADSLRRGQARDLAPRWLRTQTGENTRFKLSREAAEPILAAAPDKVPTLAWLRGLTIGQLRLFIDVSLMADGDSAGLWPEGRVRGCHLAQKDVRRSEAFQFALILSGVASSMTQRRGDGHHSVSVHKRTGTDALRAVEAARGAGSDSAVREVVEHDGIVWCPRTENGSWFARREGKTYFTGNTAFCVGDSGVKWQASNPQVGEIVREFWDDPANRLGEIQELFLRSQLLMGEKLLQLMTARVSQVVRFAPNDPECIEDIVCRYGNPLWPYQVILPAADEGGEKRRWDVVQVDDETGLRTGECMFWAPWRTLDTDTRGMPFLTSVLDDLDSYGTVLSNLIDRTALARYMVWDVTVAGGQDKVDEFVAARGGTHIPPSGSVEVHNDAVTWEPKTVSTGAAEDTMANRSVLTNIAGGTGLAKTWLAEPEDANRATSLTMAEPVRRRVGSVQKVWLAQVQELVRYVVDRAVAAKRLPARVDATDPRTGETTQIPASQAVIVTGPEIAASDSQLTAQVLLNLSTGLESMVTSGILSQEAAAVAARKAWEDYVGVPWTADLDGSAANPDDVATAVEDAKPDLRVV